MSAKFCPTCGGVLWGMTMLSTAHPCVCRIPDMNKATAIPSEDFDAPMELVYTHELEALRKELENVTAQRDAALAALRRMQVPIEYSSGTSTTPEWLKNVQVYI